MKSGAMTVPKLVAIILAIVLLVFLVFGATQLKPLGDKLGLVFDNVLYFFKLGHYRGVGGCNEIPLINYQEEGELFLNNVNVLGANYANTFFVICDDGTCGIDFQSGEDYQISDGKFESSWDGKTWFSRESYLFPRSAEDTKEDWEIYNNFLDLMEINLGKGEFKKIYDERVTKSFWLYGNGEGWGDAYYAYWESGVWYFWNAKTPHLKTKSGFMTVAMAVSDFYNVVSGGGEWYVNKDEAYYTEKLPSLKNVEYLIAGGTPERIFDENKKALDRQLKKGEIIQEQYDMEIRSSWKPINFLIGGKNYEINNNAERDSLIIEVEKIIERLDDEAKISNEEITKLRDAVVGKEIVAGDVVYVMNLEMDTRGYPKIIFTNGSIEYYLKFNNDVKTLREKGFYSSEISLRHYPLELTDNKPNRASKPVEVDYKLPKSEFDKFYKLNLIENFIREKCR